MSRRILTRFVNDQIYSNLVSNSKVITIKRNDCNRNWVEPQSGLALEEAQMFILRLDTNAAMDLTILGSYKQVRRAGTAFGACGVYWCLWWWWLWCWGSAIVIVAWRLCFCQNSEALSKDKHIAGYCHAQHLQRHVLPSFKFRPGNACKSSRIFIPCLARSGHSWSQSALLLAFTYRWLQSMFEFSIFCKYKSKEWEAEGLPTLQAMLRSAVRAPFCELEDLVEVFLVFAGWSNAMKILQPFLRLKGVGIGCPQ